MSVDMFTASAMNGTQCSFPHIHFFYNRTTVLKVHALSGVCKQFAHIHISDNVKHIEFTYCWDINKRVASQLHFYFSPFSA